MADELGVEVFLRKSEEETTKEEELILVGIAAAVVLFKRLEGKYPSGEEEGYPVLQRAEEELRE